MEARACWRRCAGSAASSAPSTWPTGHGLGAGRPGTPPAGSSVTWRPSSAEQADHAADDADKADVAGHDRGVGRVLGHQLDVAVAALEALDSRVAVDHGDHDRAVGRFLLGADKDHVAVEDAGVDHAFAPHAEQEVAVLGDLGGQEDVVLDVLLGQDGTAGAYGAADGHA